MKKLTSIFLVASLALASCEQSVEDFSAINSDEVSFTSQINDRLTKVTSSDFESGDVISVFAAEGMSIVSDNVKYIYNNGKFTSSTPIVYESKEQELAFTALYPYNDEYSVNDLSFQAETNQAEGDNFEMSDLMASFVSSTSSRTPDLVFKHLLSLIDVEIKSDVEIESSSLTINAKTGAELNALTSEFSAIGDVNEVTPLCESLEHYKAVVAPQSVNAGETLISFVLNGVSYDWVVSSNIDLESGYKYSCVVTVSENEEGVSVSFEGDINPWTDGGELNGDIVEGGNDVVDLSSEGTANCYIATPGVASSFSAQYKGNSNETIGEVASAKLVWQDTQSLFESVEYNAETKSIEIMTSSEAGNGVVAACDAAGNILWSWHIWVADYNPEASLYTTPANAAGTTWVFMDRNVGATTTERSGFDDSGMIYQWGRKDPFTSAKEFTVQEEDYSYSVDGEGKLYDIDNNVLPKTYEVADFHGTIAKSIANPNVYYKVDFVNTGELDEYGGELIVADYITKDWVDESNDDYWGGISNVKTIYDPCPVGYKVPTSDADGNTPYDWVEYNGEGWVYDDENGGIEMNGVWVPGVGTRVFATGGLDMPSYYSYGGMWIGNPGKASSNLEEYPDLYGQYFFVKNSRFASVTMDSRSQGMSLRCVKE